MPSTTSLRRIRLWLHGLVLFGIGVQILNPHGVQAAWEARRRGFSLPEGATGMACFHLLVGAAIVAAILLSFILTRMQRTSDPGSTTSLARRLARAAHLSLDLGVLIFAILGSFSWYFGSHLATALHSSPAAMALLLLYFTYFGGLLLNHRLHGRRS